MVIRSRKTLAQSLALRLVFATWLASQSTLAFPQSETRTQAWAVWAVAG